ncbi:hypothetical protein MHU86_3307 [Fragilaria crotonensis]|nr:hypothetical protein MHU86_3307 [Fragilaria crotonensis]
MLTKELPFPQHSLEAFTELKKANHGGRNKPQKVAAAAVCGGAGAAVAAPAAIGAAGYTAAGIAANSYAASAMAAEAIAAGGGVAAGGFTATMQSVGAVGIVASGLVVPIVVTGALIGAGVACGYLAVGSSKSRDYAQVGDYSSIAHGNIVALHSERHNRFIRLCRGLVNGHGGRKDIDKFPEKWGSEEFLVIQLAESTFAFYSVPHGQYIGMNKNRTMAGIDSKAEEDDENFDEHEFIVRDEGNGKISLLSLRHDCFVRMDDKGNMDGNAVVAREWEHFNVVLLLKNPVSTD